jgi:putative ABC transport system permease protein
MFITALNTGASIKKSIAAFQGAMRYDLKLSFSRPASAEAVGSIVRDLTGVARVEGWGQARGSLIYPDGTDGNEFTILGPQPRTDLILPRIVNGRWLQTDDRAAIVVNHIFIYQEPQLKVGDDVTLRIGRLKTTVRIVGVIRQIGAPTAIMNAAYLATLANQKDRINTLAVVTEKRSAEVDLAVSQRIEAAFKGTGYDIQELISIYDIQKILEDHFVVLTTLLLVMAVLILIVGGLGLSTTMSLQVLERTREIGVMRAIGASNRAIFKIVRTEGLVIGALSWILAVFLAIPISKYVADLFGMIFLRTTLDFAVSPIAFVLWLVIVLVFSLLASHLPARNATRLTVSETLSYE